MKILFILLSFNLYALDFTEVEMSLSAGDWAKAEQWLAQVDKSNRDYNKVDYIKARIALQKNKLDDAEDYLEKAIKNYPHADTYNLAGGIYGMQAQDASIFYKLGYAKKSKKYLQKAHEADPTNVAYMEGLIQFNIQAPGIAGGDIDAVEPLLKKIEKLDNNKAVSLRVQFLVEEEGEETALAYLNKEIATEPANMDYHLYKGFLLSSMDKPDHAVAVYKTIIASDDSIAKYHQSRFQALYQLGKLASINEKWLEEGKNAYITFINHEKVHGTPAKSWAAYRLGIIYKHLKQKDLAQQSFQNALSLNPKERLMEKVNKEIL